MSVESSVLEKGALEAMFWSRGGGVLACRVGPLSSGNEDSCRKGSSDPPL